MPKTQRRRYNETYSGEYLNRVAFPLGGIGAGMICLEGTATLSHVSLRHQPEVFNEPVIFSALTVLGSPNVARVLEGPVPDWKIFGNPDTGNGASGKTYGLPRLAQTSFRARFPFGTVELQDDALPLRVTVTGWSPFVPGDADNSSLPVAALEYTFHNPSKEAVRAVYSFHARNFMATGSGRDSVAALDGGFVFHEQGRPDRPWEEGHLAAAVDAHDAQVNCAWFRGDWFDPITIAWKHISEGRVVARSPVTEGGPSPGGSVYVPFELSAGESKTICLRLSWYVPYSNVRTDAPAEEPSVYENYRPWYATRFASIHEVARYWQANYDSLREATQRFTACFYDSSLPPEILEAVSANLSILKSPTVLRQHDGRFWAWEGCCDAHGCCPGSCTHVWYYAQAVANLFPTLERSLRASEFNVAQDDRGHQTFRVSLPIRPTEHNFHAAADGQLGGIIKVYRDWRISGDTEWMRSLWPKVEASLDYGIRTWDPDHVGVLMEPHHNTYDIEFWGPNGMCTSFYLAALTAASAMGQELGEDVSTYSELLKKGRAFMEEKLFDGEYFFQKVQWEGLRAGSPSAHRGYSPEALELLEQEGPKYQYGTGCLSDGVLGAWLAQLAGLPPIVDAKKIESHLRAVHKYNLQHDLSHHANPQRPSFAVGAEGGLLLCSWPKGGQPSLPFVYSNEVWTGIEYQVASHLMMMGLVEEGLEIVRVCRDRYDGRVRNPFNEYECGHWYARALASYALLQGYTGVRYDAVSKVLHIAPPVAGDFRSFFCTATGYGTVGVTNGKPFVEVKQGVIDIDKIEYTPGRE